MKAKAKQAASSVLCWIYLLRNTVNDKVYVGQTWTPLKGRWNGGNGYLHCTHINNAIKLYGKQSFYYEILLVANTQKTANHWERYFIAKYQANNRVLGYNLTDGGSNGKPSSRLGARLTNEQKAYLSKVLTGRVISIETRQKLSKAGKGRIMSREAVEKARVARIGKKRTEEQKARIRAGQRNRKPMSEEMKKQHSNNLSQSGKRAWATKRNTPERDRMHQKIIAMYLDGATYPQIQAAAQCGENTITRVIKRAGLPLRGQNKPVGGQERDNLIIALYRDGKSMRAIGLKLNITGNTVKKRLLANGIVIRSKGKRT